MVSIKKFFKFLFLLIISIVIGVGVAFSGYIGLSVYNGFTNAYSREDTKKNFKEIEVEYNIFKSFYDIEEFIIPSTHEGHEIPAIYIKGDDNKNIAVMVHGMGGTKETLISPASVLLELGYDVIAIDQRNSGDNMAPLNTFGVLESYDILDAVNYARNIAKDNKILLWGESYGGASAAIVLGRDESNIDYLILDCPISDGREFLEKQLEEIEAEQRIPTSYMMFVGNLYTKYKMKFDFEDFDAAKWLETTRTPTLIFNSKADTVTPEYMGQNLYDAIPHDQKELVTSTSSPHVEIHVLERDLYKDSIAKFLSKY